ncbi:hypothetical protein EIN_432740 [Entamoeba invadens IP1]|uniref:Uncharacterized protein n=1 Tax=Entamoeba invadens IP1 TaxID=370355 RepID=A0A0A1UGV5_ENTIV|nr:hypothetical protein EIN_432740 [Entamoeba invadens IP1]ELP93712.1 hypothetical protein EIN_432740 [Entamoeba invadens IP1]|eukprot:XP_004260483.1 hypothetical protein EIN_432740 [Entamoeba invadens IP1]
MVYTNMRKVATKKNYKILVDKDKRTFVDGKLYFPLGSYMNSITDLDINNFTGSPFNLMVSYPMLDKKQLDYVYTKSNGQIRVINNFSPAVTYSKDNAVLEEKLNWAKARIEEWKTSNGLFGYYMADEPGVSILPSLSAATWAIRDNDENHIAWPAVNQRFILGKLKEGFDVVGIPDYPVQTFDDLQSVWIVAEQGRKRMGNTRAMWNIPQIFDWTVYNKTEKLDWSKEFAPTEVQLKNMVYQTIVGGAMGIIYYDYSEVVTMDYKAKFTTEWEKIKKVTKELKDNYVDIIYSNAKTNKGYKLPLFTGVNKDNYLGWRMFRKNNKDYILIVNVRNVATTYKFTKPSTATLKKIDGKSTYTDTNNVITIALQAMDVMWFEGTDTNFTSDESKYSTPNIKSEFVEANAIDNEDLGDFPELPTTPEDPSNPPINDQSDATYGIIVVVLAFAALLIL